MGQRSRKRRQTGEDPGDRMRRGYARSEARNEAIRQSLAPLEAGERPLAVTIGAIVALVMAVGNVVAWQAGVDVASNEDDAVTFTILSTAILLAAAAGMWARRYWAVLGFEAVLGFQIASLAMALMLGAIDGWKALPATIVLGLLGWLFWKLIRAMARMQMPERPGQGQG